MEITMCETELREIDRHEATSWMSDEQYGLYFDPKIMEFLRVGYGWFYEYDDRRFTIEPAVPWGTKTTVYILKELQKDGKVRVLDSSIRYVTKEDAIEAILDLLDE
jgi:hypothetical protein